MPSCSSSMVPSRSNSRSKQRCWGQVQLIHSGQTRQQQHSGAAGQVSRASKEGSSSTVFGRYTDHSSAARPWPSYCSKAVHSWTLLLLLLLLVLFVLCPFLLPPLPFQLTSKVSQDFHSGSTAALGAFLLLQLKKGSPAAPFFPHPPPGKVRHTSS